MLRRTVPIVTSDPTDIADLTADHRGVTVFAL